MNRCLVEFGMAHLRAVKNEKAPFAGQGVRVLMLSDGSDVAAKERVLALGGQVDCETELFTALAALMDDPMGYGLFVMDADAVGGIDAGLRGFQMLRAANVRIPVILVGRDCDHQLFPDERSAPIMLKAPLSMVSLRVGVEHALHDRMIWRAA
jgi:hypothetical protein